MPWGWPWSVSELEVALGTLGLPTTLLPFEPLKVEQTLDERERFEKATFERLRGAGALSPRGRWDPDLEALLRLFAGRGAEAVITVSGQLADGTTSHGRGARSAVAGIGGWLTGDGIELRQLDADDVVADIVNTMPLETPAAGRAVRIPLGNKRSDDENFETELYDDGKPTDADNLDYARELLAKPKLSYGMFAVFGQDYDGALIQLGTPSWFDTEDGRWMFRELRTAKGRFAEISPATNRDFGKLIGGLARPPR